MDLSYVANQKARKAIDNVRVILNKIHLFLFTASLCLCHRLCSEIVFACF